MKPLASAELGFLAGIPHPQRSILLLSAVILVVHPRGSDIVREVHAHHPGLDGQELCRQVIIELMASISKNVMAGSTVLMPVAVLIGQTVRSVMEEEADETSPFAVAERLWELVEELHEPPELTSLDASTDPSRN